MKESTKKIIEVCLQEKNEQCIKESCPFIGREFDDNWGLEDPTGKSDEEFKIIIKEIESKILKLRDKENTI